MATLKVNGILEVGKVVLEDWDISSQSDTSLDFTYKNDTVAKVKANVQSNTTNMVPIYGSVASRPIPPR